MNANHTDSGKRVVEAVIITDSQRDAGQSLDVAAIIAFVRRWWLWIGVFVFLAAVASTATSYLFPRIYRAEVLLSPVSADEAGSPLGGLASRYGALASLVGVDLREGDYSTAAVIAMLTSRQFLEQFIAEENLMPKLFPKLWDEEQRAWKVEAPNEPPSLQDAYEVFRRSILSVLEDKETGLVVVRVEWRNSKEALPI